MHVQKGGCKLGLKLLLKSEISHLEKGILKEVILHFWQGA